MVEEDAAVFVSAKGTKFTIESDESGLWRIIMHGGGVKPPIVYEKFTTKQKARGILVPYLEDGNLVRSKATIPDRT